MRKDLEGLALSEPPVGEAGDDVRLAARETGKDVQKELGRLSFNDPVSNRVARANLVGIAAMEAKDVFGPGQDTASPIDKTKGEDHLNSLNEAG